MRHTLNISSALLFALLLFSCTVNPTTKGIDAKDGIEDNSVDLPVSEEFSIFGRWHVFPRGLYIENGEEVINYLPPGASSPIMQVHYYEIMDDSAVQHFISVSPISEKDSNNVFKGDDRVLSWKKGTTEVTTDLFTGSKTICSIYRLEKNSFVLRCAEATTPSYDVVMVFSRVEDDDWEEDILSRAMLPGTPAYESKISEYNDFVLNVLGHTDQSGHPMPFSLQQSLW